MNNDRGSFAVPTRKSLIAVWFAVAAVSVVLLAAAGQAEGGRDDRDQAEQRVGFLDEGLLPMLAPPVTAGVPASGQPTVLLFLRPGGADRQCRQVARTVESKAAVVVVISGPASCPDIPAVVVDPDGRTAVAYGMRVPADSGPPVGYAIVDDRGMVRYRTLDPNPASHRGEILTILDAL